MLGQLSEHSIDVEPTANQCCEQNDNDVCFEILAGACWPISVRSALPCLECWKLSPLASLSRVLIIEIEAYSGKGVLR